VRASEGRLEFNFQEALSVERPEVQAQPFKCVDFLVDDGHSTWMIEVTEALRADQSIVHVAVADLLGQIHSGNFMKDMLMKLYGTHAHLALVKQDPRRIVFFCVVVGLPRTLSDAAQRNRMRDEMKRITNRVGPSFHGTTNRPIIKVESIESWNTSHPNSQIT
jgi:hypothetical protein